MWVFLFLCGYGVLEFLYFKSQTCDCGRGVWMCLFWVVRCFGVCASVQLSVWIGEERIAEVVSVAWFVLYCRLRLLV